MPIHTDWKSMAKSMAKQYKEGESTCRPFTDGTKVCAAKRAWSVFFATLNKNKWDETKSRPTQVNETVFEEAVNDYLNGLLMWAIRDKE